MDKDNYIVVLVTVIVSIIAFKIFSPKKNNEVQEPFTAKINQMWRPHYRNLTTYTNDTINTSVGNMKRALRQNGLL
jgi:hypothetical protein